MTGKQFQSKYFNKSGETYTIKDNVTFYPNFNHDSYSSGENINKFRNINIGQSVTIGKSIFEFESGVPQAGINEFVRIMQDVYNNVFPWLFLRGKVFVMTSSTYNNYSIAYALTHGMSDSSYTIDLHYDDSKKWIGINGALHELAHAWDKYYRYTTGKRLCDSKDFDVVYKEVYDRLYIEKDGTRLSKNETIVSMFTNYYWHILGYDKIITRSESLDWYGLQDRSIPLNENQKYVVKEFMEKYAAISSNGYNKIN